MLQILIGSVIGLTGGCLAAAFGLGGGIVIVPALVYTLHFSQKMAQGTSLAMMLPPIGLLAAREYYKSGNVDVKMAIILIVGFLIGSALMGRFVQQIPELYLRRGFAVLLVFTAVKMWLK